MSDEVMEGAEPQFLPGENSAGFLLLHDLGDTPQVVASLAAAMSEAGFALDVPLLPGHGTDIGNLAETTWDDWAGVTQLALDELVSRCGPVVVAGIGLGATLACWAAADRPEVVGVVAINPRAIPVPQEATEMLEAMLADGAEVVPPLRPDVSNHAKVLAYPTVPVRTLISMFAAIKEMADHWDSVKCPVLCVISGRDHRVSPANAEFLRQHVNGPVETVHLQKSFHLATLDVEHKELEEAVVAFAERVMN